MAQYPVDSPIPQQHMSNLHWLSHSPMPHYTIHSRIPIPSHPGYPTGHINHPNNTAHPHNTQSPWSPTHTNWQPTQTSCNSTLPMCQPSVASHLASHTTPCTPQITQPEELPDPLQQCQHRHSQTHVLCMDNPYHRRPLAWQGCHLRLQWEQLLRMLQIFWYSYGLDVPTALP